MTPLPQDEVQAHSLSDPESFWIHQAEQLHWHKKPSRALTRPTKSLPNGVSHPSFSWFPDGEISTSYNCVDRHVRRGNGDFTAIIWDSPVSGSKEKHTYNQLHHEVETLAGVLREEGVRKGDVVLVYSMFLINKGLRLLTRSSADDTCCSFRHSCNFSTWRHSYCCFWRFRPSIACTKDRGFKASSCLDSILRY